MTSQFSPWSRSAPQTQPVKSGPLSGPLSYTVWGYLPCCGNLLTITHYFEINLHYLYSSGSFWVFGLASHQPKTSISDSPVCIKVRFRCFQGPDLTFKLSFSDLLSPIPALLRERLGVHYKINRNSPPRPMKCSLRTPMSRFRWVILLCDSWHYYTNRKR